MKTILAAMLLLWAGAAGAGDTGIPGCADALAYRLPEEADGGEAEKLRGCESSVLAAEGDYVAARRCAWAERANEEGLMFEGNGMLATIYANGYGVPPDLGLARRLVCESDAAYAEIEARLERLQAMESGKLDEPFDLCDDITSGYGQGFCAEREARTAREARDAEWEVLLATWPAKHRAAWNTLRAAADEFFDARVAYEVDVSGTGRTAFIVHETEALAQGLLGHVQAFERGDLPAGTEADLAKSDRELNVAYAAARRTAKPETPDAMFGPLGTIRPEGILDTEREWLRYRDAWVAFGKVRYPTVSATAWQHHFTQERVVQLRDLSAE